MDNLIQLAIVSLSGLAIWLATGDTKREKMTGASVGVIAQVFWIIDTVKHDQWGMVMLSFWYLFVFLRILYNESKSTKVGPTDHIGPK